MKTTFKILLIAAISFYSPSAMAVIGPVITACHTSTAVELQATNVPSHTNKVIQRATSSTGAFTDYAQDTYTISNLQSAAYFRVKYYTDLEGTITNIQYSNVLYIELPNIGKVENLRFNNVAHGYIHLLYSADDVVGWSKRPVGGSTWTSIPSSAGLKKVSIEGITASTEFFVEIESGCVSGGGAIGTLTIVSELAGTLSSNIYQINSSSGSSVSLTLSSYSGTIVQWEKKTTGDWTAITNTSTTYGESVTEPTQYRVKLTVSAQTHYSNTILVDVLPAITTSSSNYVKSKQATAQTTNPASLTSANSFVAVNFYDGLGRTTQSVVKAASPGDKDIVSFSDYNGDGLQPVVYQSFTATPVSENTAHSNPATAQSSFYTSTPNVASNTRPYAQVTYENDLSAQVSSVIPSGQSWSAKSVGQQVGFNTYADAIRLWTPDGMSESEYAEGVLIKREVTDEDGNLTLTFTDKNGREICRKKAMGGSVYLTTYFVYDDYGRLRFILPPEAMNRAVELDPNGYELVRQNTTLSAYDSKSYVIKRGTTLTLSTGFQFSSSSGTFEAYFGNGPIKLIDIDRFVYEFQYDHESRLIARKIPGSDWEYFVYDKLGRILLTQTALQRQAGQWTFVKYDSRGRSVYSGIYTSPATRAQQQAWADASSAHFEGFTSEPTYGGYTSVAFPTANLECHQINHYDGYSFTTATYDPAHLTGQPGANYTATNDWLTGQKTRILGTNDWLSQVVFYDEYGRVIQVKASNHLSPNTLSDVSTVIYDDFTSKVLKTRTSTVIGSTTYHEQYRYEYNGRKNLLQKIFHQYGAQTEVEMVSYTYNELGQVISKKMHYTGSEYVQETDFTYNERGWLSAINNPDAAADPKKFFALRLHYHTSPANVTSDAAYNGAITGMEWSSYYSKKEAYGFQLDGAERLKNADYAAGSSLAEDADDYNEEVTAYDHNGNIQGLRRYAGGTKIDDLTYQNDGNQLRQVSDSGTSAGFANGASSGDELTYDASGNLTKDLNKGITSITWNHLNKPIQITFSDGRLAQYLYSASGAKLQRIHKQGSTVTEKVDYVANYYVKNDAMSFASTVEGRIVPAGSGGEYQYYHRDHLGNVRSVYTANTPSVWTNTATMETENATAEDNYWFNISRLTYPDANTTPGGNEVQTLDPNNRDGAGTIVEVFPGDNVSISVKTYYTTSGSVTNNAAVVLADIANAIFTGTGGFTGEGFSSTTVPGGYGAGSTLMTKNPTSQPKAFVNYLFFDKNFNYVNAGFAQVAGTGIRTLTLNTAIFDQPGYLFIYLTYEATSGYPVSFDDFSYTHNTTRQLASNSYYPFGMLTGTSWVRPENPLNRQLYNAGNERNEVTGYDETFYRLYDPALGRFAGVDILAVMDASRSPYTYAANSPINFNDPMGDRKTKPYQSDPITSSGFGGGGGGGRGRIGSGDHWSDGIDNSDWTAWGGSMSYREAKQNGFVDRGDGVQEKRNYGDEPDVKIEKGEVYVRYDHADAEWVSAQSIVDFNNPNQNAEYVKMAENALLAYGQNGGNDIWDALNFLNRILDPYTLPDAYSVSGNVDVVVGGGVDVSPEELNKLFILQGKDAGQSTSFIDISLAVGLDIGASTVLTKYYYTGDVTTLSLQDFDGFRVAASAGISAFIEVGGGIIIAPVSHGGYIIGVSTHIGLSPPGISGNGGGGFTRIRK